MVICEGSFLKVGPLGFELLYYKVSFFSYIHRNENLVLASDKPFQKYFVII